MAAVLRRGRRPGAGRGAHPAGPAAHRARRARPRRPADLARRGHRTARRGHRAPLRRRHRARRGRARTALIGTFASLNDPSLVQNRCFLYHLIGNGTGEWRVPIGGMGAVTTALARAATEAGAEIITSAGVSAHPGRRRRRRGHLARRHARAHRRGPARAGERRPLGAPDPDGRGRGRRRQAGGLPAQDQLPARPAAAAEVRAWTRPSPSRAPCTSPRTTASSRRRTPTRPPAGCPSVMPGEVYCHSLTDPSILGASPDGTHTLTYFGLHTPASLFDDATRAGDEGGGGRAGRSPRSTSTSRSRSTPAWPPTRTAGPASRPRSRRTSRRDLAMPGGHIFHGDLDWPWAPNRARLDTPAQQWGVQTDVASVLVCGSGVAARRRRLGPRRPQRGAGRARLAVTRPAAPIFPRGPAAGNVHVASPRAALAQLAEQLTLNQRVRGSSP